MSIALFIVVGVVVGFTAAWVHLELSWRAARRVADSRGSPLAVLSMPLRVIPVALALAALGLWSTPALLAGLLAFGVAHRVLRTRWKGGEP